MIFIVKNWQLANKQSKACCCDWKIVTEARWGIEIEEWYAVVLSTCDLQRDECFDEFSTCTIFERFYTIYVGLEKFLRDFKENRSAGFLWMRSYTHIYITREGINLVSGRIFKWF